jgi:hypothetical protein
MTDKDKKIFKISAYIIGGMLVFFAIKTIAQIRARRKVSGDGNGGGGGMTPAIQPTITRQQALGIADSVFNQIDDVNYITGVDETIELLSPIQNIEDWKLVFTAYGTREKINFGLFNNFVGDLVGALRDEYDGDDLQKIRNFFTNKGINTGI